MSKKKQLTPVEAGISIMGRVAEAAAAVGGGPAIGLFR